MCLTFSGEFSQENKKRGTSIMRGKSADERDSNPLDQAPREDASSDKQQSALNRRQFIAAGTGAAAAIFTTGKALTSSQSEHAEHGQAAEPGQAPGRRRAPQRGHHEGIARAAKLVKITAFPQPAVLPSSYGVLDTTLNVAMLPGTQIRAYNNNVPGPTLKVNPGDQLKLVVANNLPPNPPPPNPSSTSLDYCANPNMDSNPHCFNSTNLHTHGLHVSPETKNGVASDDVLIEIKPGKSQPYCIQLPTFHAPGTHWYHAHKHGAAAIQIAQGLAGVLIVAEPDDQKILPFAHPDYVFLMQEILVGTDAQFIYTTQARQTQFYINGQLAPGLTMLQGEIQRWRFVNGTGTPRGLCQLALVDANNVSQTMYMIARDGISFYGKAPQPVTTAVFSPGQRIDFLVQVNKTGTYKLMKNPFPQNWGAPNVQPQVLATVNVGASPIRQVIPARIPGTPPAYLRPITQYTPNAQTVTLTAFTAWGPPCSGPAPSPHPSPLVPTLNVVNCKEYDPNQVMFTPRLNTSEEWVLQNGAATSAHPFHIHVNPFQVEHMKVDPNGPDDASNWMWLDTVPVLPPGAPAQPWFVNNQTKILSRFLNYPGEFVLHCHLLTHEDMGLMANVKVIDDGTGTGPCVKI
jgi:FtsP/CotA-like multicopper oxidase with cupredoxin domain